MIYNTYVAGLLGLVMLPASLHAQDKVMKKGYYPDGKIRYEGYFAGEQPVGDMVRYYPDGKIQAKLTYEKNETRAVLYDRNNAFLSAGKYVDKKKEGEWQYKKGERLLAKENYKANRLDGESVRYYISGNKAEIKEWKDGRPSGQWKMFYDNGKIRLEASFVNGGLEGKVKSYDIEGKLIAEGNYSKNLKEGTWRYYDGQGKTIKEEKYVAGVLENQQETAIKESEEIDALIKAGTKIADPSDFADDPDTYLKISGD